MEKPSLDDVDDILTRLGTDELKSGSPGETGHDNDDEKDVDRLYNILCQSSIWDELCIALYDVRYLAPLVAIFATFLAYHITIAPYRVHIERNLAHSSMSPDLDLNTVRPVITPQKQYHMQRLLLHAETNLELPTFENIRFKFFTSVPEHGNFRLPQMFYQGVTFGITALNSHDVEHTSYSTLTLLDLEEEIRHSFKPKPTYFMRRSAVSNDSLWEESGFALYYSYADLQNIGKLSADADKPWKRILEPVLDLARRYKQSYITVWYPRAFGAPPSEAALAAEKRRRLQEDSGSPAARIPAVQQARLLRDLQLLPPRKTTKPPPLTAAEAMSSRDGRRGALNFAAGVARDAANVEVEAASMSSVHRPHPLQHSVLLQEVLPTRTGLDGLKSSAVVWLQAVDDLAPHLIDFVRQDDW